MATKDLFIHAIQQVEVDGNKNIPTAVHYKATDDYAIGYDALAATIRLRQTQSVKGSIVHCKIEDERLIVSSDYRKYVSHDANT